MLVSHDRGHVVDRHPGRDKPGRIRMAKIMKSEPALRAPDKVLGCFPRSGEFLGPVATGAVLPVRYELVLTDLDDLAQQSGTD